MALAHELTNPEGGPSTQFHIAEARLHLHRKCYQQAEVCLRKAITSDVQVRMHPPCSSSSHTKCLDYKFYGIVCRLVINIHACTRDYKDQVYLMCFSFDYERKNSLLRNRVLMRGLC